MTVVTGTVTVVTVAVAVVTVPVVTVYIRGGDKIFSDTGEVHR
jgi:hypothetical protein